MWKFRENKSIFLATACLIAGGFGFANPSFAQGEDVQLRLAAMRALVTQ